MALCSRVQETSPLAWETRTRPRSACRSLASRGRTKRCTCFIDLKETIPATIFHWGAPLECTKSPSSCTDPDTSSSRNVKSHSLRVSGAILTIRRRHRHRPHQVRWHRQRRHRRSHRPRAQSPRPLRRRRRKNDRPARVFTRRIRRFAAGMIGSRRSANNLLVVLSAVCRASCGKRSRRICGCFSSASRDGASVPFLYNSCRPHFLRNLRSSESQ